jgi:hypothetical protein
MFLPLVAYFLCADAVHHDFPCYLTPLLFYRPWDEIAFGSEKKPRNFHSFPSYGSCPMSLHVIAYDTLSYEALKLLCHRL